MTGGRKAAYLATYMVTCLGLVAFTKSGSIPAFLGVTGFFLGIIVILLVIQGAAVGRVTKNIRKEWDK